MREVKLIKPPDHINRYLTHWTGRGKGKKESFEILSIIVNTNELKFTPCKISYPDDIWKTTNEMICFTDTPITQSYNHCKKYNYFGISFNKDKIIEFGASPVLYIVENRRCHQKGMKQHTTTTIFENNEIDNLITWYDSIGQPYNTEDLFQYEEREWRIIRILPYKSNKIQEEARGPYNEYPYKGTIRSQPSSNKLKEEDFFLKFDPDIIENIIVPEEYIKEGQELLNRNKLKCELIVLINN